MQIIGKPKIMRRMNKNIVLMHIRHEEVVTKAKLHKLTGMSLQTINNIVKSLIKKKLVIEEGYGNSTTEGGKKPQLLKFNQDAYFLIGGMIELKYIRFGITNLGGKIIIEKIIDTKKDSGPEKIIKNLIALIKELIDSSGIDKEKIIGIGIGVPGIVDFEKGIIEILPLFSKWENIYLRDIVEKNIGIPVFMDNENRMRAVGEKWFGIAKNTKNFITLITGDGIGSGIVVKDDVIRGTNNICGEIGHMKLKSDGPECACGARGCFETLINTKQLNELIKEEISKKSHTESPLIDIYNKAKTVTLDEIFENYNKKDKFAEKIVENIIKWFGMGIGNLVCLYDPEMIIIHGVYTKLANRFYDRLNEVINQNVFPKIKKNIKTIKTEIGDNIGIIGSASMVLDNIDL